MAYQSVEGAFCFPEYITGNSHRITSNDSNYLIDAAAEAAAMLFEAPISGDIDRVFAYIGAHTSIGTLDVRLETIDVATGSPSGTLVGTTTNGPFVTSGAGVIDVTLTLPATVVKGTQYALVIVQAAGNCVIRAGVVASFGANAQFGFTTRRASMRFKTGGAYAARNNASSYGAFPLMALRYTGGSYHQLFGAMPFSAFTRSTFNNTTTARERGIRMKWPFPVRVTGYFFSGDLTNQDADIVLADSSGTALLTASLDKDLYASYAAGTNYGGAYEGWFSSTADIPANTVTYLTIKPTGASDIMLIEGTLLSGSGIPAQMGGLSGGTEFFLVTRDSGGTYDVSNTHIRPLGMGVRISAFGDDASTGGSGMLVGPGMAGGMRG